MAAVMVAVVAGVLGYWIATNRSAMTMHTCRADAAPTQVSATCADGWVYDIPVARVNWTDASGTWHNSGRPDCIPAGPQQIAQINFGSVDVSVRGSAWRSVVYVSCG